MRPLAPLLVALLGSCSFAISRPDQDNYEVDAASVGGSALAQGLADRLNLRVKTTELAFPRSDRAEMYELIGEGFTIDLVPLPDNRCDTKASLQSTYKDQRFRADLVFTDRSSAAKESTRHALLSHVQNMHLPITEFEECSLVEAGGEKE